MPFWQQTTIRNRLVLDLGLLIALTGGAIVLATWVLGNRSVEQLSQTLVDQTSNETETQLNRFFDTVNKQVIVGRAWAASGLLDPTDHVGMNALFVPILERHPQMSSMMVADSTGAEYMLLRDPANPNSWTNRVVEADRKGKTVFLRKWNSKSGTETEFYQELDYDPRRRIWYQRALQSSENTPVFWTKPVIFFTTKDPGITASTTWKDPSRPASNVVVAFDLLLLDISRFTSRLKVGDRGKAFVLVEDTDTSKLRVVGLPPNARYGSDKALRDALIFVPSDKAVADSAALLPPLAREGPELSNAVAAWREQAESSQPFQFSAGGVDWWGGLRRYPLGDNTFWIGVVVPESDLSADLRRQQSLLLVIVFAVLVFGIWRAITLAQRFGRPIEQLVQETKQISDGNFDTTSTIASNLNEINALVDAQNQMRDGLRAIIQLEKVERDLDIARDIQRSLLPSEPPDTPGFEVVGHNRPADKAGGDYFGWLTLPDGKTLITLADVAGHGIGPALLVSVFRSYIRAAAGSDEPNLNLLTTRINELLQPDMPDGRFITAVFVLLDEDHNDVLMLSAGQAPLIYFEAASRQFHVWNADDLPLGAFDLVGSEPERHLSMASGDLLVLVTDGFFEAKNAAGEPIGVKGLHDLILAHHDRAAKDIMDQIYRQVDRHTAGAPAADDITAVIIKRV